MSNQKIDLIKDIKGAVYISAQAYNPYQMWRDYSSQESARDMGYAQSLNLNAVRIWLSYEYWLEQPEKLRKDFDDFLKQAAAKGIKVMPSLFEGCGIEPTKEAREDKNPLTAIDTQSPSLQVIKDENLWGKPLEYMEWFMSAFRNDERLLAIEIMNEPWVIMTMFARRMYKKAVEMKGCVPLTYGAPVLHYNMYYLDLGLDILQFHENFPTSEKAFISLLNEAKLHQEILGKPVWITEWQRMRKLGTGWGDDPVRGDEWQPGYASMADMVHASGLGSFLWSLMIKPAYLSAQRKNGTLNGIFHEDGAVWSLDDARAVSRNPSFTAVERKEWPSWAAEIPKAYLSPQE